MFKDSLDLEKLKKYREWFEGPEWQCLYETPGQEGRVWDLLEELRGFKENLSIETVWSYGKPVGIAVTAEHGYTNWYQIDPVLTKVDSTSLIGAAQDGGYKTPPTWYEFEEGMNRRLIYLAVTKIAALRYFLGTLHESAKPCFIKLKKTDYEHFTQTLFFKKNLNCVGFIEKSDNFLGVQVESSQSVKSRIVGGLNTYLFCANVLDTFRLTTESSGWTPEQLRKAKPLITRFYYRMVKQQLEMSGEQWRLKVVSCLYLQVNSVDELKQQWRNKGYTVVGSHYELSKLPIEENGVYFEEAHRPRGDKQLVSVFYSRYVTLDHKYNDGRIAYYRHILKRHIYDYYRDKDCKEIKIYGNHDKVIWQYVFEVMMQDRQLDAAFILKGVNQRLESKITYYQNTKLFKRWILTNFTLTDDLNDDLIVGLNECRYIHSLLNGLAKYCKLSDLEIFYQRTYASLLQELCSILKEEGWIKRLPGVVWGSDEGIPVDPQKTPKLERVEEILRILHDVTYPYTLITKGTLLPYFTPTVLGRLLKLKPKTGGDILSKLNEMQAYKLVKKETFRMILYRFPRDPEQFKEAMLNWYESCKANEVEYRKKKERSKLKKWQGELEVDNLVQIEDFLGQMREYCEMISLESLLNKFNSKQVGRMIKGEIEGVFEEEQFTPRYDALGRWIHSLLKGENTVLTNPKRLYAHLRKVLPVSEIIQGHFTREQGLHVLSLIKQQGVSVTNWYNLLNLTAKVEAKCSPQFLVAGDASVCCMSFGASNAMTYANEKAFGVLNFYAGDRIFANSVLWLNEVEDERFLVLDNIEVHPNYQKYKSYLKPFYFEIAERLMHKYQASFTVQGDCYNDLSLFDQTAVRGSFVEYNAVGRSQLIEHGGFYTDAKNFIVVSGKMPPKPTEFEHLESSDLRLCVKKESFEWVNLGQHSNSKRAEIQLTLNLPDALPF